MTMQTMTQRIGLFLFVLAVPALVCAQQTVTKGNAVTKTMTIQAIDSTSRALTVKFDDGEEDTFAVGPEMKRFNELKVGDKIKASYYESLVLQLRKPGDASAKPKDELVGTAGKAAAPPSGTIARQQLTTVTVQKVGTAPPSLTVLTADGRTVTRKVENAKLLESVKPGDRIDITYTQAFLVDVEPVK